VDSNGRTIWIADAHRDDGKCFVARADEKLTAFLELESAISACGEFARQAGEIFPELSGYEKNFRERPKSKNAFRVTVIPDAGHVSRNGYGDASTWSWCRVRT